MNDPKVKTCALCEMPASFTGTTITNCLHFNNGYCAYFRWKAAQDAVDVKMKKPANQR